jgi:hypothetical protein
MSDQHNTPADEPQAIDLSQQQNVNYWTNALGVCRADLEQIIAKVGTQPDKVRAEITTGEFSQVWRLTEDD